MSTTETSDDEPTAGTKNRDGCKHYENKCEILAPCCSQYFRCFRCHDDGNWYNDNKECEQSLDRNAVTQIRCVECQLEQEPSTKCRRCHIEFAEYVCLDCSLYRQNATPTGGIFHCSDCKICRIGDGLGISHWHCNNCVACLSVDISPEHHTKICRPAAAQDDCCICFESLEDSQQPLVIGTYCGHFIHQNCCDAYFQTGNINCPICTKPFIELPPVQANAQRIQEIIHRYPNIVIILYFGLLLLLRYLLYGRPVEVMSLIRTLFAMFMIQYTLQFIVHMPQQLRLDQGFLRAVRLFITSVVVLWLVK